MPECPEIIIYMFKCLSRLDNGNQHLYLKCFTLHFVKIYITIGWTKVRRESTSSYPFAQVIIIVLNNP